MEFWDSRYRAGKTPWDFGGIPAALSEYLRRESPRRALIPGCGTGYDVWPRYSRRTAELLTDGGRLIGLFLYSHEDEPPPFPMTAKQAQELFGADFTRVGDEPVNDSLPRFAGRERWQVWQKRQSAQGVETS